MCIRDRYSPINQADFIAQYTPIQLYIQPELVWVAEYENALIGLAFALPDLCQAQRGQTIDTAILKTLCVHPDWAGIGLASLLGEKCQAQARALGYRRVIHALMHEKNRSRKMSRFYGKEIRRYALFGKVIEVDSRQCH